MRSSCVSVSVGIYYMAMTYVISIADCCNSCDISTFYTRIDNNRFDNAAYAP